MLGFFDTTAYGTLHGWGVWSMAGRIDRCLMARPVFASPPPRDSNYRRKLVPSLRSDQGYNYACTQKMQSYLRDSPTINFRRKNLGRHSEPYSNAAALDQAVARKTRRCALANATPLAIKLVRTVVHGGMGEWLIPAVLKTVVPERVPGVRIPLPPPLTSKPRRYAGSTEAQP